MDLGPMMGIGMGGMTPQQDEEALAAEKRSARKQARAQMDSLGADYRSNADAAITDAITSSTWWQDAQTVFCYVSLPSEVSTRALLEDALSTGKRLCVPLCTGPSDMELHQITSLDDLHPGTMGILEPDPSSPEIDPWEVFLTVVPCVACTRMGIRLGKGGGYYDRFLAGYRGLSVIPSYERMLQYSLPAGQYDMAVPLVVTEQGVHHFGRLVP